MQKSEIAESFIKQAEICQKTSILYHDLLKIFAEDELTLAIIENVTNRRVFNSNLEPILTYIAFFHYGVLDQQPDFRELASFFSSMGGSYNNSQLPLLKNILKNLVEKQTANLQEWLLNTNLQTNETARCSVIYPAILSLGLNRFNLIELGCSAGLLLLLDQYSYEFTSNKQTISKKNNNPLLKSLTPEPEKLVKMLKNNPQIATRIGVDLNPLDLKDKHHVNLLKASIWDDPNRKDRLTEAIELFNRLAENLGIKLIRDNYNHFINQDLLSLLDPDADIVFFSSVSTYQISDHDYQKLLASIEYLSQKTNKLVYLVEFEGKREVNIGIETTVAEPFLLNIHSFPERTRENFALAHFHGSSFTITSTND